MLQGHQPTREGGTTIVTIVTKKSYRAPKLQAWGSVVALTQVGQTRPGNDCFGGSVNPPGHDKGCPNGHT